MKRSVELYLKDILKYMERAEEYLESLRCREIEKEGLKGVRI